MDSLKPFPKHKRGGQAMAYSTHRARFESALAAAHRALGRALDEAIAMASEGDEEDVAGIMAEITRVATESLKDQRRKSLAERNGQLRIPESS